MGAATMAPEEALAVRTCTAYTAEGKPHRCGKKGRCTRVVLKANGRTTEKHWVCADCRHRMSLPGYSVVVEARGGRMVERRWRG